MVEDGPGLLARLIALSESEHSVACLSLGLALLGFAVVIFLARRILRERLRRARDEDERQAILRRLAEVEDTTTASLDALEAWIARDQEPEAPDGKASDAR